MAKPKSIRFVTLRCTSAATDVEYCRLKGWERLVSAFTVFYNQGIILPAMYRYR